MRCFRVVILAAAAMFLFALQANASHFRYGHISWTQLQGNTIQAKVQNAWRRDGYACLDITTQLQTPCSGTDGLPGVGDVIVEDIGHSRLDWGDGSSTVDLLYLVTAVDPVNNWLFGEALDDESFPAIDTSIEHTYATEGNFTANLSSCCRIGGVVDNNEHINNPDSEYRVETLISVGSNNSSPISVMSPVQICPANGVCSFTLPAADPDGDALQFRFSTADEAGSSFNQPTGATIDPNTGTFTWNTSDAELASPGNNTLYSTQIMIEDGTNKVALDFFIQLANEGSSAPPIFQPPADSPPICNTTQIINVGDNKSFVIQSSDRNSADSVTLNVAGMPLGATMDPSLPIAGNPVASTFSWRPDASQAGVHIIKFNAESTDGGVAECPVTLSVLVQCDVDNNNFVDRNDIKLIMAMRNNDSSGPLDPRDANGDGMINVNDARFCVTQCTSSGCNAAQ